VIKMQTVASADGTTLAYDRCGHGPAVILVAGALGYRSFKDARQTAAALSEHCTAINYDRRGRGDSGPAGTVSLEHEIEDIAALIDAVGGSASLCGFSSGAALALRAAAAGIGVETVIAYEPPFKTDPAAIHPLDDYGSTLDEIVATGDAMAAAKHFMRSAIGLPGPMVTVMSLLPTFKRFAANGLTLPFDLAALGEHNMHGWPLEPEEWAPVRCPTLVAFGSKTYAQLKHAARAVAAVLPDATVREIPGQKHNVKAGAIAPVVAEFVTATVAA
jgi:pimeloyl-ACP methyl ester carboxylesterase